MADASPNREFAFSDADYDALRKLVKEITGINLTEQKRKLVYGRLARRLRVLQLQTFAEYRDILSEDGGEEIRSCATPSPPI